MFRVLCQHFFKENAWLHFPRAPKSQFECCYWGEVEFQTKISARDVYVHWGRELEFKKKNKFYCEKELNWQRCEKGFWEIYWLLRKEMIEVYLPLSTIFLPLPTLWCYDSFHWLFLSEEYFCCPPELSWKNKMSSSFTHLPLSRRKGNTSCFLWHI